MLFTIGLPLLLAFKTEAAYNHHKEFRAYDETLEDVMPHQKKRSYERKKCAYEAKLEKKKDEAVGEAIEDGVCTGFIVDILLLGAVLMTAGEGHATEANILHDQQKELHLHNYSTEPQIFPQKSLKTAQKIDTTKMKTAPTLAPTAAGPAL